MVTAGVVARAWLAECKAAFAAVKCISRLAGRCKAVVSPLVALLDDGLKQLNKDCVFDVGAGAGPCTGPGADADADADTDADADADVSGPPLPVDDVLTM